MNPIEMIAVIIGGALILSILFIGPGVIIGLAAKRKNRSFWKWLFFSVAVLVIPRIITVIIDNLYGPSWPPEKSPYSVLSMALLAGVCFLLSTKPGKCPRCKKELKKEEWEQSNCHECGQFEKHSIQGTQGNNSRPLINHKRLKLVSLVVSIFSTTLICSITTANLVVMTLLIVPILFFLIYLLLFLIIKMKHKMHNNT